MVPRGGRGHGRALSRRADERRARVQRHRGVLGGGGHRGRAPVSPPRARRLVRHRARPVALRRRRRPRVQLRAPVRRRAAVPVDRRPALPRDVPAARRGPAGAAAAEPPGPRPRRPPRRAHHHGGGGDGLLGLPHGPVRPRRDAVGRRAGDVARVPGRGRPPPRRRSGAGAAPRSRAERGDAGREPPGAPRDRRRLRLAAPARRLRDGRPARRGLDHVLRAGRRRGTAPVDARDLRAGGVDVAVGLSGRAHARAPRVAGGDEPHRARAAAHAGAARPAA